MDTEFSPLMIIVPAFGAAHRLTNSAGESPFIYTQRQRETTSLLCERLPWHQAGKLLMGDSLVTFSGRKARRGGDFACGKCVVERGRPRSVRVGSVSITCWMIAREPSFWRSWTLGGPPFIHPPGPRHARQACTSVRRSFSAIGDVFRPNNWRTNSPMAKIRLSCAKKTAHLAGHSVSMGPRVQIQPAPPSSP